MASKAKISKQINIEKQQKKLTKKFEGALDNSYYVNATMKNGVKHMATIIDCRILDASKTMKKTDSSYEYYIHYDGVNRRMDEWVSRARLEPTDIIVEDDNEQKKKRKLLNDDKKLEIHHENSEHEGMDQTSLRLHEEATKFKTIPLIQIGKYQCDTWYYSPLPNGYHNISCLYFCEFCLNFYKYFDELKRHSEKCFLLHPPGDEIYRYENNSVFEIDGTKNPTYCENLCYLSKLFLDHKNLFYDVDPFLFFVLTENDENGQHIIGYFSKEKESSQNYNLACILVLPMHQRKGYGKFLITFSYELSLKEGKVGTPERPLSDLGKESYLAWWIQQIIDYILQHKHEPITIQDITKTSAIREVDILWSMEQKNIVKYQQGNVIICTDEKYLAEIYKSGGRAGRPVVREKIHWIPFKFKYDNNQLKL